MNYTDKGFYLNSYSVSMDNLMEVWIETFHTLGTVLVIWDARTHFDVLQECGILVKLTEAYENKAVTIELPGPIEAYELMDSLHEEGCEAFMQVYEDGKLLSDNVGPIV